MKNTLFTLALLLSVGGLFAQSQNAINENPILQKLQAQLEAVDDDIHCEVPCGIYGDSLRIMMVKEHIRTVEKAMTMINKLSGATDPNYNQIVRWVVNKEKHAEEIQEIVSQYFMHQRIKPVDQKNMAALKKYNTQLMYLHHMSVYAMKCKQSTDQVNIGKLTSAVEGFEKNYFHKHDGNHKGHKH